MNGNTASLLEKIPTKNDGTVVQGQTLTKVKSGPPEDDPTSESTGGKKNTVSYDLLSPFKDIKCRIKRTGKSFYSLWPCWTILPWIFLILEGIRVGIECMFPETSLSS